MLPHQRRYEGSLEIVCRANARQLGLRRIARMTPRSNGTLPASDLRSTRFRKSVSPEFTTRATASPTNLVIRFCNGTTYSVASPETACPSMLFRVRNRDHGVSYDYGRMWPSAHLSFCFRTEYSYKRRSLIENRFPGAAWSCWPCDQSGNAGRALCEAAITKYLDEDGIAEYEEAVREKAGSISTG